MTETLDVRKERGAFFTPPGLASFVTQWAVRSRTDRVLEPSCGEAAFLEAAARRLEALGSGPSIGQLFGVELHEPSAKAAESRIGALGHRAEVQVGDFFESNPPAGVDAVIGNPPYVRYQGFVGEARARAQRAALTHGVHLGGLASSWAAFVVHASSFLSTDGRMGLVLPAELLSVNYAGPVRRFLLERFRLVRLVLFEERVFPGVLEEVVLLLAEGRGPTDHFEICEVHDSSELGDLRFRRYAPGDAGTKWTAALLPPEGIEALATVTAAETFTTLVDWGDPDLGMVTGSNEYFTLSLPHVSRLGLDESELLRISPPGSRHLRNLAFTPAAWRRMADEGARTLLFYPNQDPSGAARRYIREGERRGISDAYKCRVRTPWWRVPLVRSADLFFTYMNHVTPQLAANSANVLHVNSVHGLRLHRGRRAIGKSLLPMGALSSATILGAEVVGRAYGGGLLKMEPKEADLLPVPSASALSMAEPSLRAVRGQVSSLLSENRVDEAATVVDDALLVGALRLDEEMVDALRGARRAMFSRRMARTAKAVG
jgi:adenine-specific DNA-methyltransferase